MSILEQRLNFFWMNNNMASSNMIYSNNTSLSLEIIKNFISKIFSDSTNLPLNNNIDFFLVDIDNQKQKTNTITIDQIREAENFLSKKPVISDYKFLIVNNAQLLNNNAANACLKILEEAKLYNYIFLISNKNMIATIESRCRIIRDFYFSNFTNNDFLERISALILNAKLEDFLKFHDEIVSDHILWNEYIFCILEILILVIKSLNGCLVYENLLIQKIKSSSNLVDVISLYEKLSKLFINAEEFDLDKKQISILIWFFFDKIVFS